MPEGEHGRFLTHDEERRIVETDPADESQVVILACMRGSGEGNACAYAGKQVKLARRTSTHARDPESKLRCNTPVEGSDGGGV